MVYANVTQGDIGIINSFGAHLRRGSEGQRDAGFKIQWGQPRVGSIPTFGTTTRGGSLQTLPPRSQFSGRVKSKLEAGSRRQYAPKKFQGSCGLRHGSPFFLIGGEPFEG